VLGSEGLGDTNRAGTYLATFRAVAKKYPTKAPEEVLDLLVAPTPGDEGTWFAAAKGAGSLDEAIAPAKEAADRLGTGADLRARVRSIIAAYARAEAIVGHVLPGQLTDA
jgi:hypothetical protein